MKDNWNIVTPTPLPKDGERVEWVNDNDEHKRGIYIADEEMFAATDPYNPSDEYSDFDFAISVGKWRALPFIIIAAIAAYIYMT